MSPELLEAGYWRAYHDFYRWSSIVRGAWTKHAWPARLRHLAYAGGWKKFEPLWDRVIRARRVSTMLPLLERILEQAATTTRQTSSVVPANMPASPGTAPHPLWGYPSGQGEA